MKLTKFVKDVNAEMHKVVWPTAKETRRDTTTVVSLTIFFIIFFAIIDWLLHQFMLLIVC